jgi:hypothetical protein
MVFDYDTMVWYPFVWYEKATLAGVYSTSQLEVRTQPQ